MTMTERKRYPTRGFASMSPEKQREIASKGGKAAHAQGAAHEWDAVTAREAAIKGVLARQAKRAQASPTY